MDRTGINRAQTESAAGIFNSLQIAPGFDTAEIPEKKIHGHHKKQGTRNRIAGQTGHVRVS
jgi:hypothetical protein